MHAQYPTTFTCYYNGYIVQVESINPVQAIILAAKRFKLKSPKSISGITAISDNYCELDNNKMDKMPDYSKWIGAKK